LFGGSVDWDLEASLKEVPGVEQNSGKLAFCHVASVHYIKQKIYQNQTKQRQTRFLPHGFCSLHQTKNSPKSNKRAANSLSATWLLFTISNKKFTKIKQYRGKLTFCHMASVHYIEQKMHQNQIKMREILSISSSQRFE
jgi:hypothetical protein